MNLGGPSRAHHTGFRTTPPLDLRHERAYEQAGNRARRLPLSVFRLHPAPTHVGAGCPECLPPRHASQRRTRHEDAV